MLPPPPPSTLFPYTTLFRSARVLAPELERAPEQRVGAEDPHPPAPRADEALRVLVEDRKSTRLNSSHVRISYAVFCLKKKKRRGMLCWEDVLRYEHADSRSR